jgi:hypothetical protein
VAQLPEVRIINEDGEVTGWVLVIFTDEDALAADPEHEAGFLGAVFTEEARWPMLGLFGLNPGGAMTVLDFDRELPAEEFRNVLLNREQLTEVLS